MKVGRVDRNLHLPQPFAYEEWMDEARCVEHLELFDETHVGQRKRKAKEALAICRTCPVIEECRRYVDRLEDTWSTGVAAGETAVQRRHRRAREKKERRGIAS